MSILIDRDSRVLVQGITGFQGKLDTRHCVAYGTNVVCGVTPGRGGERVEGIPVYDTVAEAVRVHGANVAVTYVPAPRLPGAIYESLDAALPLILSTTENVPRHDAARMVAAARAAGTRLVGFNTNGMISPGRCKLAGIGGDRPDQVFMPGRVGVCSRSGGMSAEIGWTLKQAGLGISTCISMGGDPITGMRMVDYARLFQADPETDAMVFFGEPGTQNEQELAAAIESGEITKPAIVLLVGYFQESFERGMSFGHIAAMIADAGDSATAKRDVLARSGATVVDSLDAMVEAARAAGARVARA